MRSLLVLVLLATAAHADTMPPAARAKGVIDAQVAAFKKGGAGKKAFLATFDVKGVIVGDGGVVTAGELAQANAGDEEQRVVEALFDRVKSVATGKVTVGGVPDAVWFSFDLTETFAVGKPRRYRVSELVADRGGLWKVVVAHVGLPRADDWEQEEESAGGGPTRWGAFPSGGEDGGQLARLAVTPTALAKALAADPVVIGTSDNDVAIGHAAATKLVAGWAKLELGAVDSVELHAKTWGVAVVQVVLPTDQLGPHGKQSMKMRASVIAMPKSDGTWEVVVAQYSRVAWY